MILSVFAFPPHVTATYYTSDLMLGDLSQGMAAPAQMTVSLESTALYSV